VTLRRIAPALVLLAACQSAPERPEKEPPPRPPAPASASASTTATTGGAALPTASASAPASPFAGTWEGSYDAKKGAVSLPPKVKDKALAADDGKGATGAGTIEITITDAGAIRGTSKGALGACTITGKAEEGMIRASIRADDPRDPNAMTGVLVGMLKGDAIKGEIRVAGRDATIVRESTIELKKK
jgi:hypothetical protein